MKFFNASQIKQLDNYTIEHEPISSINLMERAAEGLYKKFSSMFSTQRPVCILAGPGNNGGDALALARLLLLSGYSIKTHLLKTAFLSPDCKTNRQRLLDSFPNTFQEHITDFITPSIDQNTILIDGLFGSGLCRPLNGIFTEAVSWLNSSNCEVIAIDIPSGLHAEDNTNARSKSIVKATYTFSLQFPKLSFLLAENEMYVGNWSIIDIGLHPQGIDMTESNMFLLEKKDILPLLKKRNNFSHKGAFGHCLIIAGSAGMAGASILCSKAALRSGVGLVTACSSAGNRNIIQTAIPEVIFLSDEDENFLTKMEANEKYNAIAIGPGIGQNAETQKAVQHFLANYKHACILDADALNIISENKSLLSIIPENSILTPHPKEFDRLFGKSTSSYERVTKALEHSTKHKIFIILKGANTAIATPSGKLIFNSTGNSGMATAGSGDVLTGILASLLAQGYTPEATTKIAVYLHGLAGDLALLKQSKESLIASDIIDNIGSAFKTIRT